MWNSKPKRLTGAVILVALLVLLVPELLTGPRSTAPPAPAQPDQAPMRAYTMDLVDSTHVHSAPVAASTAAPPASEPTPPASAPEPAQTQPVPVAVAPPTAPPETPPIVKPATQAVHARMAAPLHATQHTTPAWTVQLATFSNRDNAARLVARLKAHGFSASITQTTAKNGGTLFRVRAGTEKDRAAAQKLLGRLRAAGEKGGEIVPR